MTTVTSGSIDGIGRVYELVERVLDIHLKDLGDTFDADPIAFNGSLAVGTDDHFRDLVETLRTNSSNDKIVVLLTTVGGFLEETHRMVETLRHHYTTVEFVIPNYAYSAGTVLVLSGDAIHMDYYSRLGPIDPQIQLDEFAQPVPALGYVEQYDKFVEKEEEEGLNEAELEFFIAKFDPVMLEFYEQDRERAIDLLKEWMPDHLLKDARRNRKQREKLADEIGETLSDTDRWRSHNHGISMQVARDELKISVNDFGVDPKFAKKIRTYHNLLSDYLYHRELAGIIHIEGVFRSFGTDSG